MVLSRNFLRVWAANPPFDPDAVSVVVADLLESGPRLTPQLVLSCVGSDIQLI